MNDLALRLAIAVACAWTKFYTWGLPFEARAARCEEIESDLWESVHDPDVPDVERRWLPLHIGARLLAGVPDDLGWRSEFFPAASAWRWRVAVTTGLAIAMLGLWLVAVGTRPPQPPELPASLRISPNGARLIDAPPPPPPPPPPCAPQGFPQPPGACTR